MGPFRDVVIVGAGQAGLQAAASLREAGHDGRLCLVGDEPGLPYQRPPLSKAYLKDGSAAVELRAEAFFADNRIERIEDKAIGLDRSERRVRLKSGAVLGFGHLIIATGAGARRLDIPGAGLDGVLTLRTRADSDRMREAASSASHVVVIGAGFVGLEVAATLASSSRSVTVVELAPRALGRAVSEPVADALVAAAIGRGIRFRFGTGTKAFTGAQGRLTGVTFNDGTTEPADLAVVAIGAVAHDGWLAEAGLATGRGVAVDRRLSSADPAVAAIGDAALLDSRHASGPVRIESVQNAVDQGRHVALRIVDRAGDYEALPWFWSDQGPHKLQIAGLAAPDDRVVIRASDKPGLTIGRFRAERLVAVETIDRAADHMLARRLIGAGTAVTPAAFADAATDLKVLVPR